MQEHRVTAQGTTYTLEEPFYVFATQNPIELEGTYPLPEAQLDRFMFEIIIEHLSESEELEVVRTTTGIQDPKFSHTVTGPDLMAFQRLVRSMGDDLRVESTPGQGSRFSFALPLVIDTEANRHDARDIEIGAPSLDARLVPDQQITALVVDDSTVSRRILASLLEAAGVQVITAAGGLEAIASAREHRPDVIFMDLRMGDIDGFEATRRLRAEAATRDTPIIAITSFALSGDEQRAKDAGASAYLAKPYSPFTLLNLIRHLVPEA